MSFELFKTETLIFLFSKALSFLFSIKLKQGWVGGHRKCIASSNRAYHSDIFKEDVKFIYNNMVQIFENNIVFNTLYISCKELHT